VNADQFREHMRMKSGGELFVPEDIAKTIHILEKRIEDLERSMAKVSGWQNKEIIRQSIKTNLELLDQARKEFWK